MKPGTCGKGRHRWMGSCRILYLNSIFGLMLNLGLCDGYLSFNLRVQKITSLSLICLFESHKINLVSGLNGLFMQIILGGLVFGDKLTWFNIIGLVVAMAGSLAYNIARTNRMRQTELSTAGRAGKAGDT